MKKAFFLILFTTIFIFSCSDDDDNQTVNNPELIGTWELIEIYADPGDGSGDFESVESNKIVEFRLDETIVSNGTLCQPSIASDTQSSGTFSSTDSTINISECTNAPFASNFEIQGSNLIISYACIEACQEKYIKIEESL